jgi:mono/diheme cytochrome c family protein
MTHIAFIAMLLTIGSAQAQSPDGSFGHPFRFLQRDGAALYRAICQGCHMSDGAGAVGAGRYPPLARNERLATSGHAVHVVVHGQGAMPPFGRYLSDDQVAAVVNHVRGSFGNAYTDKVTAENVKGAR